MNKLLKNIIADHTMESTSNLEEFIHAMMNLSCGESRPTIGHPLKFLSKYEKDKEFLLKKYPSLSLEYFHNLYFSIVVNHEPLDDFHRLFPTSESIAMMEWEIRKSKTIKVIHGNQPVLEIKCDHSTMNEPEYLNRDRNPDAGWNELRWTRSLKCIKEIEMTPELRQILFEDLAFAFGHDSKKLAERMKHFNLWTS